MIWPSACWQMSQKLPLRATSQNAGNTDPTCPGAAGQRDAAAALPGAHGDLIWALDLNEVDVDAPRKQHMILQHRTDTLKWDLASVLAIDDRVRITHGNTGHSRDNAPAAA